MSRRLSNGVKCQIHDREPMTTDAPKPPKVDSTLSKGLSILETLAASTDGKGVTELSKELGLTKSNTFRLLQTLTTLGYVQHNSDKSYAATLKAWRIGRALIDNLNLRELAAPELAFLSHETGEAIYLAVRENLSVVYIDKVDSPKPIRSWNAIGGTAPLHCVGTGKALLAAEYPKLREQISAALTQHTDRTITDISALDDDIALTLKLGYGYDTGEFRDRILSLGAVISLPSGEPVGALGISFPDINLPDSGIDRYGSLIVHAARSVSAKLGKT
jgi:IclR family KDG regulon transcriptional repressor